MRKLLTLVLLAAFGLPVVAPAFALGQDPDASLPVCCRRNGAHHCAMRMGKPDSSKPIATMRCPAFPQPSAQSPHSTNTAITLAAPSLALHRTSLNSPHQADAFLRIARERSRFKRGPPSVRLS